LLTTATEVFDEAQVADDVISPVVLSEKVPVAVYCTVVPDVRATPGWVMVICVSVAPVTVRVEEPEMLPEVAVILAVPAATAVTFPLKPDVLLTAATGAFDELHVTDDVISCVLLSEKVPIAVNCSAVSGAMLGLVVVTAMDTSVAEVTIRVEEPEMLPEVAVIVAVPAATAVTFPLEPDVLLIVAAGVFDELHVTDDVIFCVLLSEKVPVAVNCSLVPRAMIGLADVTAMDTSVAEVTVRAVAPEMFPEVAVIVVVPAATGVTCP
jgi:hypothetical protein